MSKCVMLEKITTASETDMKGLWDWLLDHAHIDSKSYNLIEDYKITVLLSDGYAIELIKRMNGKYTLKLFSESTLIVDSNDICGEDSINQFVFYGSISNRLTLLNKITELFRDFI